MQIALRSQGETAELRHGVSCLWPSEIAEQFYCEYKVHLKRVHPEVLIELAPLELGKIGHDTLATQAEPVTAAEIEESIRKGEELAICEWVLEGNFRGVWIRGRPDLFAFEGKKALLLLEFKFSSATEPFRDHKVQSEIYAWLTESMGFTAEQLCFGIVMFPPIGHESAPRTVALSKAVIFDLFNQTGTLHAIYESCETARRAQLVNKPKRTTVKGKGWKAYLFPYDANKAVRDLSWAVGYWLSKREPIPAKRSPRKCFSCVFNAVKLCEHALQQPNPSFGVRRLTDGRVSVYLRSKQAPTLKRECCYVKEHLLPYPGDR